MDQSRKEEEEEVEKEEEGMDVEASPASQLRPLSSTEPFLALQKTPPSARGGLASK